jgi:hypothetical protein
MCMLLYNLQSLSNFSVSSDLYNILRVLFILSFENEKEIEVKNFLTSHPVIQS